MSEVADLRIIGVALVEESMRSHRVLHNLDPEVYPVLLILSRPADRFDAKFLHENLGILVNDHDAMQALIPDTSIDALKANIDDWNRRIALAGAQAQHARETALAEDQRRQQVADELHRQVSPR